MRGLRFAYFDPFLAVLSILAGVEDAVGDGGGFGGGADVVGAEDLSSGEDGGYVCGGGGVDAGFGEGRVFGEEDGEVGAVGESLGEEALA